MNTLVGYIESLEKDSFEGWTEDEKSGYLTATGSIKARAQELLPAERTQIADAYINSEANLRKYLGNAIDEKVSARDYYEQTFEEK